MKDFQTWYDLLIADTRWYEQVTMKYKGNFQLACEKLYGMSVKKMLEFLITNWVLTESR